MIKTSDFVKRVKSMGINVESIYGSGDDRFFEMGFAGFKIALVAQNIMGKLNILPPFFKLDISDQRQLVELMMDYAQTPLNQREEKKWNVILGKDYQQTIAYRKNLYSDDSIDFVVEFVTNPQAFEGDSFIFTDEEFSLLHDRLKRLYGLKFAKIAELGKVPAPEVENGNY